MRISNIVSAISVAISLTIAPVLTAAKDGDARAPLIYFLDPESPRLLQHAEKQDFLPLLAHFISEYQATFCGIASSVMALNALRIAPPLAPRWYPYDYWTQDNIFSREVLEKVKPVSGVEAGGVTLDELTTILNLSGANADRTFAADTDVDSFRNAARSAIADPNTILIVNFARSEFGQAGLEGGGHISPVGAYSEASDRFLVLDVARYKYPPSWVTAERLYAAMNTTDESSGRTRGYVIVRK